MEMNADDALAAENRSRDSKPGPDSEALDTALSYLRSALASGPRQSRELLDDWRNGYGGSQRTLDRAKPNLGIEAYRLKVPGPWWWRLPSKDAKPAEGKELGDLGTLVKDKGVLTVSDADECKDAKFHELGSLGPGRVQVTI